MMHLHNVLTCASSASFGEKVSSATIDADDGVEGAAAKVRRTELSRLLDTGDVGQDRVISATSPLPQLLIFAKGSGSSVGYHGSKRWRRKVFLAAPDSGATDAVELIKSAADYSISSDLRNPDVAVPPRETYYHEQIWGKSDNSAPL